MTTKPRPANALIREIERNVRSFVDGGKTRGDFDRRARLLWDEAALDPTVYADLSAYFAKVTLARGTLSETRVCGRGEHDECANAAHCGCACHRDPVRFRMLQAEREVGR